MARIPLVYPPEGADLKLKKLFYNLPTGTRL